MRIEKIIYSENKTDRLYLYRLNDEEVRRSGNKTDYIISEDELDLDNEDEIDRIIELIGDTNYPSINKMNLNTACVCMELQLEISDLTRRIRNLQNKVIEIADRNKNSLELLDKIAQDHPDILAEYTGISNNIKPYDL